LELILFFAVAVFTLLPFFAIVTAAFFVTLVDGFFATVPAPFLGVTFLLAVVFFYLLLQGFYIVLFVAFGGAWVFVSCKSLYYS
jgi:hypothetical protein